MTAELGYIVLREVGIHKAGYAGFPYGVVADIPRKSCGFGCVHEEFSNRILSERTVAVPYLRLSFMFDRQEKWRVQVFHLFRTMSGEFL